VTHDDTRDRSKWTCISGRRTPLPALRLPLAYARKRSAPTRSIVLWSVTRGRYRATVRRGASRALSRSRSGRCWPAPAPRSVISSRLLAWLCRVRLVPGRGGRARGSRYRKKGGDGFAAADRNVAGVIQGPRPALSEDAPPPTQTRGCFLLPHVEWRITRELSGLQIEAGIPKQERR